MSRDPWRLKVFVLADELVVDVYRATAKFPAEERFGLQSQLRRAAVSAAANLVEGSARRTLRDYLHFAGISLSSGSEARYLIDLSRRLGYLDEPHLRERYTELIKGIQALIESLERRAEA